MLPTDFTPPTETIPIHGSAAPLTVRALNLDDILALARAHFEPMTQLFNAYVLDGVRAAGTAAKGGKGGKGAAKPAGVPAAVLEALTLAPALVADVIVAASDSASTPGARAIVRKLPTGVQIAAVEATIRLTLEAEGGLEKLVETVSRLADGMAGLSASLSR